MRWTWLLAVVIVLANTFGAAAKDCGSLEEALRRYDALQFEEAFPDLKCRALEGDREAQFRTGAMYRFGLASFYSDLYSNSEWIMNNRSRTIDLNQLLLAQGIP